MPPSMLTQSLCYDMIKSLMSVDPCVMIISLWCQLTHVLWLSVSDVSWLMCHDYQSLMSVVPGVHTIRHHVICARSSIQTTIIELFVSLIFFFICNVWTTNFINNLSLLPPTYHITHSLFLAVSFSHYLSLLPVSPCAFPLSLFFLSLTLFSLSFSLFFCLSVSLTLFLYQPLTLRPSSLSLSSLQCSLSPTLPLFFFCSASFCLSPSPPPPLPQGGAQ